MIRRLVALLLLVSLTSSLTGVVVASPGCPMARKNLGCPNCKAANTGAKSCCASHKLYLQINHQGLFAKVAAVDQIIFALAPAPTLTLVPTALDFVRSLSLTALDTSPPRSALVLRI